jgi:protein TonB
MTANGREYSTANGDLLVAGLHQHEIEDARRRHLLAWAIGLAIALHVALLAVRTPPSAEPLVIRLALKPFVVQPTPRFVEPKVEEPPPFARRVRRVPMPDPTPDEIEPLAAPAAAPIDLAGLAIVDDAAPIPAPPPDDFVHEVGGKVLAPKRIYSPDPVYPRTALVAHQEATVVLEATLDVHGNLTSLRPLTSHGFGFEQAALDAVRQWRFEPGTLKGKPVPVLYRLSIVFRIGR